MLNPNISVIIPFIKYRNQIYKFLEMNENLKIYYLLYLQKINSVDQLMLFNKHNYLFYCQ